MAGRVVRRGDVERGVQSHFTRPRCRPYETIPPPECLFNAPVRAVPNRRVERDGRPSGERTVFRSRILSHRPRLPSPSVVSPALPCLACTPSPRVPRRTAQWSLSTRLARPVPRPYPDRRRQGFVNSRAGRRRGQPCENKDSSRHNSSVPRHNGQGRAAARHPLSPTRRERVSFYRRAGQAAALGSGRWDHGQSRPHGEPGDSTETAPERDQREPDEVKRARTREDTSRHAGLSGRRRGHAGVTAVRRDTPGNHSKRQKETRHGGRVPGDFEVGYLPPFRWPSFSKCSASR